MSDSIEELKRTITDLKWNQAFAVSTMREALTVMDSLADMFGPETMRYQRDQLRRAIEALS
jgi:hypothetical protein